MKLGRALPYVVGAASLGAVVSAFSSGASPYVTVREARGMSGDRLHLAGDLVKGTVGGDVTRGTMEFDLKDKDGATVHVVHRGERASLQNATRLVAIGRIDPASGGRVFASVQLLVKCPSKYEAEKARQAK